MGKSAGIPKVIAIASRELKVEEAKQPPVGRPITPAELVISDTDDPATAEEGLAVDIWKAALSLHERKCGAANKDNVPCARRVGAKKIDKMDTVIELLRRPGLSDLEVETHLNNLAKLVHCHYHDDPPRCQSRVTEWLAVLPGSPRQPTWERRLRDVLGLAPTKCTSLTREKRPCGNKVSRANQCYCDKTTRKMLQMTTALGDDENTLEFLCLVLRHHMLCSTHQRYPPKAYQTFWMVKISTFHAACQDEKDTLESKNNQNDMTKVPEKKNTKSVDVGNPALKTLPSSPNNGENDRKRAARYWSDKGYDRSSFDILGKNETGEEDAAPYGVVRTVAQESLNTKKKPAENEVSPGIVHVFTAPGNEGFVKVGFTTQDVKKRHEQWRKDCNRESALLYPLEQVPQKVKHADRVERLVHAELMEHRVRIYCERCGRQHIEWFEVGADLAIASVKKWSLWMEARPYEERVTRECSEWYLKET